MLKLLLRRQKDKKPDTPFNEQQDPYLERIVNELRLNREQTNAKIADTVKTTKKEIK